MKVTIIPKIRYYLHPILICISSCLCTAVFSQNTLIDSLELKLLSTHDPDSSFTLNLDLAKAYLRTDAGRTRQICKELLEQPESLLYPIHIAEIHYLIGAAFFYEGNPAQSLTQVQTSLSYLTYEDTSRLKLRNLVLRAAAYRHLGDTEEAIKENLVALELARALKDLRYQGAIYNNLGNAYQNLENNQQALVYFFSALDLYTDAENPDYLATLYQNIGDNLVDLQLFDSAALYLTRALNRRVKLQGKDLTYYSLSRMYYEKEWYDSSWHFVNLSLENAISFSNAKCEAMALNQKGLLLGQFGRFEESREMLKQAYGLSQEMKLLRQMGHSKWCQAEIEKMAGNFEQAMLLQEDFMALKDSLFSKEIGDKVAFYQEKFKAEEREVEIAKLAQIDAENKANIDRQRLTATLTISVLIITILLAFLILSNYLRALKSKQLLASKNEVISKTNSELRQKNSQLHELTEAAQFERSRAEEANRAKSAFLANMTHEIRNPLSGLINITDLLQYTNPSPEQMEYLGLIRRNGENLIRMVDEVLDFSKIEAGKMDLEETEFNLFELMDEILALFSSQGSDKQLDLACLIDPQIPPNVKGDPHKLRQVMFNLIGNAVKFTEKGGVFVSFTLKADLEHKILIHAEVEDTGIGIAKAQQALLFNAFKQAEVGTARKFGGTGLGLAISQKLVNLMGGQLELDSELGKGSRFFFDFELELGTRVDIPSPTDEKLNFQWKDKEVLIVEKGKWSQKVLSEWFDYLGAQPILVKEKTRLIQILRERQIALIIFGLDAWSPSRNSEFLHSINPRSPHFPPVLFIGSRAMIATYKDFKTGQDASISKPLQYGTFNRLISSFSGTFKMASEIDIPQLKVSEQAVDYAYDYKILIAEDHVVNQIVVERIFNTIGIQPDIVSNGVEVLEQCAQQAYDMIFMDVNMPEMNGIEATRKLREIYPNGNCPVVVAMTANSLEVDREFCIQSGMDDYLSKPIRIDELKAVLDRYQKT